MYEILVTKSVDHRSIVKLGKTKAGSCQRQVDLCWRLFKFKLQEMR